MNDFLFSLQRFDDDIIEGTSGDDNLTGFDDSLTIVAGAGNDSIQNSGSDNIYVYGGGNDMIDFSRGGFYNAIVLSDVSVRASLQTADANIILRLSNGNSLTLRNIDYNYFMEGHIFSSLDEVPKVNVIHNDQQNTLINLDGEEDAINIFTEIVGDKNSTINGSDFVDIIINHFGNNNKVMINSGAGNDSIINGGHDATINAGDGNDTIYGFNATDSLNIADGSYSTTKSGNNIIVNVDDGSITLVEGVKSERGLYLNNTDKIVTVYKSALNETNITISDGYSLALDAAVKNSGEWSFESTKATYQGNRTPAYQLVENEVVYSTPGETSTLLELDGMATTPTFNDAGAIQLTAENFDEEAVSVLSNSGGYSFEIAQDSYAFGSTFKGSGFKEIVTNNAEYLAIDGGAGSDSIVNNADNVSIVGDLGSDKINNIGANVSIVGGAEGISLIGGLGKDTLVSGENNFEMTGGDGNDLIIDYNFDEDDILQILDKTGERERSFSKAVYADDTLKLTTQGGKITLQNVTSSSQFNINGTGYHIEGTTLAQNS